MALHRRATRRSLKLVVAVAITWAATVAGTGTASADIWGVVGTTTDTKWDQSTVDQLYGGRYANIVGFWQAYLEAYNHIGNCGIHGAFDVPTSVGTQFMQSYWGLTVDGVVGPATWDAAARFVTFMGGDPNYFYWRPAFYQDGAAGTFAQARGGPWAGYWYWYSGRVIPSGALINTSTNAVSFSPGAC